MSEKQEDESKTKANKNHDDVGKVQWTDIRKKDVNKDHNEKEDERSLEEIEKELDELRPKQPSPETKRRIEEAEQKNDDEIKKHKTPSAPIEAKSSNEGDEHHQHKDNELTPGEPDPTVNDNVKIPILNDHGDVELKPQQGSAFHKNNKNNNSSNTTQSTEENKKTEE